MIFSKIGYGITNIASKLMGISSPAQNNIAALVENSGTDTLNGTTGFFKTLWIIIRNSVVDVFVYLYELIIGVIYAIGKWVLTVIDFIFIFIRQIIGMNVNYSDYGSFENSDVIFKFIFNDNVVRIIRNLLLFAIVLLIVFSIMAIIISEYKYVTEQQGDNSKKTILANALKSILLMVLVPALAVGGIIMSNAILKALYNATAGGADTSLSNQIFAASTYNANVYRRYAINNKKIPITYNFAAISDKDNISSYGTDGGVADLEEALYNFQNDSVWMRGYKTFLMFATDAFLEMADVDELELYYKNKDEVSPYNSVYDKGIESRAEQYYIMGDVIDWALKTNTTIYFKTAEEIYKSYINVVNKGAGSQVPAYMPIASKGDTYDIDVWYSGDIKATTYQHIPGKKDEAKGAKFLIAMEKTAKIGGVEYSYYYPLLSAKDSFQTDYYAQTGQPVIAKGLFEDGEYPTAIKEEDGVVKFYRDRLNIPGLVDLFPHFSYELPEGTTEHLGTKILKGAIQWITGVDINQFVPYVYFNFDIFTLFTKTSRNVVKLQNGMMTLNYNFTQKGYKIDNLYNLGSFNMVVFLCATALLVGVLLKILFGIVLRVLDITLLAITYPAVLSAMPLDGGARFKGCTNEFVKKVLAIYGVIVGINLILLVSPIIYSVELFSPTDIKNAYTFKILPSGFASYYGAGIVNFIFQFLFVFVAFSSIEKFVKIAEGLATNWQASKDDGDIEKSKSLGGIMGDGAKVVDDLKKLPDKAAAILSGKAVLDTVKKGTDFVTGFIPGSAIVKEHKKKKHDKAEAAKHKQNRQDIMQQAKGGDFKSFNDKFGKQQ